MEYASVSEVSLIGLPERLEPLDDFEGAFRLLGAAVFEAFFRFLLHFIGVTATHQTLGGVLAFGIVQAVGAETGDRTIRVFVDLETAGLDR